MRLIIILALLVLLVRAAPFPPLPIQQVDHASSASGDANLNMSAREDNRLSQSSETFVAPIRKLWRRSPKSGSRAGNIAAGAGLLGLAGYVSLPFIPGVGEKVHTAITTATKDRVRAFREKTKPKKASIGEMFEGKAKVGVA